MIELHSTAVSDTPIDIDAISGVVSRFAGYAVAPGDVALALLSFPLDETRSRHAERVQWAVWDKETPINDVPAERIMGRGDYNGGEIYLIYIDDQVVVLQPHLPNAAAPVWADEAHEVAAIHAASIVEEMVVSELVGLVVSQATPPVPTVSMDEVREVLDERPGRRRGRP